MKGRKMIKGEKEESKRGKGPVPYLFVRIANYTEHTS